MKTKTIVSLMIAVKHRPGEDPETLAAAKASDLLSPLGEVDAVGMFSYPGSETETTVDTSCEITSESDASEPAQAEFLASDRVLGFLAMIPGLRYGDATSIAFPA